MVEDKIIAVQVRHAVARTPLDISEMAICCSKGVVELCGKVKRPRNFSGQINVQQEVKVIKQAARGAHGVKDLIADRLQIVE